MKEKLFSLVFILLFVGICNAQSKFVFPTNFKYPKIKKVAKTPQGFIPKNWKLMDKAVGDLNYDRKPDVVLVLQADYSQFLNKNDGLGVGEFNTNPRMLLILFKQANGYKLIEKNKDFVVIPDSPTMTEPFVDVSTKRNVIKFDFEQWYSAGSWSASNYSYKFRYRNGKFKLIGVECYGYIRNTGETELRSYNFLNQQVKVVLGNYADENKIHSIKWKKIKIKRVKTLQNFIPFHWEIEFDYYI